MTCISSLVVWISVIILSSSSGNHLSAFPFQQISKHSAIKNHSWKDVTHSKRNAKQDKLWSPSLAATKNDASTMNDTAKKDDWGSHPPMLAIITEPDAASSKVRMEQTIQALSKAMQSGKVDLISIRCIPNNEVMHHEDNNDSNDNNNDNDNDNETSLNAFQNNVIALTQRVISCRDEIQNSFSDSETRMLRFPKIVINDNLEAVLASNADGIHVKERNRKDIPQIRSRLNDQMKKSTIIGTSCHSISSGNESKSKTMVDYLFVGTCYKTLSHPEKKTEDDLEGPALPGLVRQALLDAHVEGSTSSVKIPKIFAIGGINSVNCWEPIHKGADGVAIIRSIMQADDPKLASQSIHDVMNSKQNANTL